jgi:hypothetical protein
MPEDPHPTVTFAELHDEIARRDQRITELETNAAGLSRALAAVLVRSDPQAAAHDYELLRRDNEQLREALGMARKEYGGKDIADLDEYDRLRLAANGFQAMNGVLELQVKRQRARVDLLTAALAAVVTWWDAGDEPGAVRIAPRSMWDNARTALGWPQPDPALDPADLRITFYDPPDATCIDSPGRGVSILHVPSGWGSSCHSERSQLQNKARALRALRVRVATWRDNGPGPGAGRNPSPDP